jgi:hypothetical protein
MRQRKLRYSINDIRIFVFTGYAIAYPLAVLPPIFIDPLLKTHVIYPSRHYPDAPWCLAIYAILIGATGVLLKRTKTLAPVYASVGMFLAAILVSFPIFRPEMPHGNLFAVGMTTTFLSAFSIFVWSIGDQIALDPKTLKSGGEAMFEYVKALFSFVRQGAFAGVTLFGALFFAAYSNGFEYAKMTVTDVSDRFFLNMNTGFQIGFYAIYAVVGPVRYFFMMNLRLLSQFRTIADRLDRRAAEAQSHAPTERP